MSLCVLCGKEYAKDVTLSHLKSHGLSRDEYDEKKASLTEATWNFYWSHLGLHSKFPDPLATEGEDGRMTFRQWCSLPKVKSKYEELRDNG
jgi:hypothetical protein